MNWKQLHALSTPQERREAVTLILRTIHARRRQHTRAHWIKKHPQPASPTRTILLTAFIFTLLTVSTATWLFIIHAPIQYGAPALAFHILALWLILTIKPYRRPLIADS